MKINFLVGGCIVLFLVLWLTFLNFFGRSSLTYLSYLWEVHSTPDETLTSVACGDVSFEVKHSDEAYKGGFGFIDSAGYEPGLVQNYYLQGFLGNKQLFSERHTYGRLYENHFSDDTLPPLENIDKLFVVDQPAFQNIKEAMYGNHGTKYESRLIILPWSLVNEDEIRKVARCFVEHVLELNETSRSPVGGFVRLAQYETAGFGHSVYETFTCENKESIHLMGNLVKLNKKVLLGTLTTDGRVHSWTGREQDPSPADAKIVILPDGFIDTTPWGTCVRANKQTFKSYLTGLSKKVESLVP